MKFTIKGLVSPLNLKKYKYNLNPILYNRVVLYFITLLALLDIVYFLGKNDVVSFCILILVGLLASFFSKNMVVILVIALCVTHVVKFGNAAYVSEGMENKEDSAPANKDAHTDAHKPAAAPKPAAPPAHAPKDPAHASDESPVETGKRSKEEALAELKNDYKEFEGIQNNILDSMQKIEPLLSKAEAFVEKFESYKKEVAK
jgi:hypothetical protein